MDYIRLLERMRDESVGFDYVGEACWTNDRAYFDSLISRVGKINHIIEIAYERVKDRSPEHPVVKWAADHSLAQPNFLLPSFDTRHAHGL